MNAREYAYLDYYQCQLTELPESAIVGVGDSLPLGTASRNENFPNLVSIRAVDNYLTNVPASIGKLTQLRELRLYKNRLSTLPDEIANLQNLIWLSLSCNRFTVFPESLTSLSRLKSLRINDNQLTVLPASIVRMTELYYLDLSGNPIVDLSILQQLPNLRKVRFANLDLPREYWIDLRSIAEAWQLTSDGINSFALPETSERQTPTANSNNQTHSQGFTQWLFGKPAITQSQTETATSIELSKQRLLRLPENLDVWRSVAYLKLNNNLLTTIPLTIGRLHQLKYLHLQKNKLNYLPPNIGNLSKLKYLDLSSNRLRTLPASIDGMSKLNYLYLNNNLLDSLPASIWEITELNRLYLNSNLLTTLSPDIGKLTNLRDLNLYHNLLESLPSDIGKLKNLTNLNLSRNKLTILPDTIGNLKNVANVDLSNNLLATLPDSIGNLDRLSFLNLANNKLTHLPNSFSQLKALTWLILANNPIVDLSILQQLPNLTRVGMFRVNLPRRYWTKFSEWQTQWLLDERNAEIRRRLIEQIGYERICNELEAKEIDTWREYSLLRIEGVEKRYRWDGKIDRQEPMVLLKMTCPSTGHIHILRVPPTMTKAESAICWVNHGIHPDTIAIQT